MIVADVCVVVANRGRRWRRRAMGGTRIVADHLQRQHIVFDVGGGHAFVGRAVGAATRGPPNSIKANRRTQPSGEQTDCKQNGTHCAAHATTRANGVAVSERQGTTNLRGKSEEDTKR